MAYATVTDMNTYLSDDDLASLTDDSVLDGATVDTDIVDDALDNASKEMDAYLVDTTLPLPTASTYGILTNINCVLAAEILYLRRQRLSELEAWADRIKTARKQMEDIRDGKMKLVDDTTGEEAPTEEGRGPVFSYEDRDKTMTNMSGW
jgi:phage gp36-like protein